MAGDRTADGAAARQGAGVTGIGAYVHLVSLAKAGPTPDDPEGGYSETWLPLDPPTWYCSIREASARDLERISSGLTSQVATHLLRGRYHAQLGPDCQVTFRGRVFMVSSVHDADQQQIDIDVVARELTTGTDGPTRAPRRQFDKGNADAGAIAD